MYKSRGCAIRFFWISEFINEEHDFMSLVCIDMSAWYEYQTDKIRLKFDVWFGHLTPIIWRIYRSEKIRLRNYKIFYCNKGRLSQSIKQHCFHFNYIINRIEDLKFKMFLTLGILLGGKTYSGRHDILCRVRYLAGIRNS